MKRRDILATFAGAAVLGSAQTSSFALQFRDSFLKHWEVERGYTLAVAEAMPVEHYNFKPNPVQRSFGEQLIHLADGGNKVATATFERFGTYLGIGVANLIDLFNPDLIVLAGQLAPAQRWYMPALDAELAKHAWPQASRNLLVSQLGPRGTVMGACGMILQSAFSQDILLEEMSA